MPKKISINEFRKQGYLQEVNRNFLHPLGLALQVSVMDDGSEYLSDIWDYRDDPEGLFYGAKVHIDQVSIDKIQKEKESKIENRLNNVSNVRTNKYGIQLPNNDKEQGK